MIDYLSKLNPQQYEAATTVEGPLLILAGAGSGKTGTMTHRIAYMIKECGISPYNVLAVTFTNKAANEMRERVETLIGPASGMWLLTFHSACLRILRKYADRIGFTNSFSIYDPVDQKTLIRNIVKELELDDKKFTPAYCLSVISGCKEKEKSAAEFLRESGSFGPSSATARVYEKYDETLLKNNAMDFDDLILNTVRLFSMCPEVLEEYQDRFRYIMVDEYQDTNMLQYKLIRMLSGKSHNLCVVGDDDQCIYEWRGADIRNILSFEKDFPGTKVIKLEQNYRSTSNIIDAAHSVISKNKGRKDKKLWTKTESGEKIEYYRADDDREEARYTAAKINKLVSSGAYNYSDIAILYRTNVQSRRFEDMFGAMNIPYQVLSGFRFYDRKEIKDMLCYMRLVINPKDDISLLRVINEPKRGIGEKTLLNIRNVADANGWNLFEALSSDVVLDGLGAKARGEVSEFVSMINALNVEKNNISVGEVYDTLLARSGYLKSYEEQVGVEAESRVENLLEFKSVIAERENDASDEETLTLEAFMEGIALVSDVDNHDADADSVVLMTLHSAKGLEFKVVFMPGMEKGIFPSYRSIEGGEDKLEEERRLCYVGMTRAKERLFMTSAEMRMLYGKTDYSQESCFLKEIDRQYLTGTALYEKRNSGFDVFRYDTSRSYSPVHTTYISPIAQAAAVKKASSEMSQRASLAGQEINAGDIVEHDKFGRGTVIKAEGKLVTVIFDSCGTKKMSKDIAPLKKV